jgi:translin
METLKTILVETRKELTYNNKVRETTYKDLRKATSLSKQSILLIHQERMKEANKIIGKARKIISKINNTAATHPRIIYCGLFSAALQEYSEANILLKLLQESRFIKPEEINVPSDDYVLGLADVIGECRRLTLDALREGDVKKGEVYLQTMDQIYIELMAMDESYMLVPGLRRKCDVARKIIEITRGDVTEEIRRNGLEKHLTLFEKYIRNRKRM